MGPAVKLKSSPRTSNFGIRLAPFVYSRCSSLLLPTEYIFLGSRVSDFSNRVDQAAPPSPDSVSPVRFQRSRVGGLFHARLQQNFI